MEAEPVYTELDGRQNGGLRVQLLWQAETNGTTIRVETVDGRRVTQFPVLGEKALEAFNHPFRFAPDDVVGL